MNSTATELQLSTPQPSPIELEVLRIRQLVARIGGTGPAEPSPMLVTFSGPYCVECEEVLPRLRTASATHAVPLKVIDIKASPELASKYDVRLTPTTFVVGPAGRVLAGWLGTPPEGAVEEALAAVTVQPA